MRADDVYATLKKKIIQATSTQAIKNAVNAYLTQNPPTAGATPEQAQQIQNNATSISNILDDLDKYKLVKQANGSLILRVREDV